MSCPSRARRLPRRPPVRAGALCYKQLNHKNKKKSKGVSGLRRRAVHRTDARQRPSTCLELSRTVHSGHGVPFD